MASSPLNQPPNPDEDLDYPEDDGLFDEIYLSDDDLAGISHSKKTHLAVNPKYAQTWTREHGFRELVQNWRDGILRTNSLTIDLFRDNLKVSRDAGLVLVLSFHPQNTNDSSKLLGFIRFKYDRNSLEGVLTMSNFKARLQRWHLSFGGSSKDKDSSQSGQHGEGMKMAVLTFRRHPHCHNVRIEASSFKWSFNFDKERRLICNMRRIDRDIINEEKRAAARQPRTVEGHIWEDVTVILGEIKQCRSEDGVQEKGRKIHLHDFDQWLKVLLDFSNPDSVRTSAGDLILDQAYANKLYLRGLHLPSSNAAGKNYRYGYNFSNGYTDRDRRAVGTGGEAFHESALVNKIWATVLRTKKTEYIDVYTKMVLYELENVADVRLVVRGRWIDGDIVRMMWEHMNTINTNDQGQSAFYHAPDLSKDGVKIITTILNLHPYPVPAEMWEMLRDYKLCRTPYEEQEHRFTAMELADIPRTPFATNLHWMLESCLLAHPKTKSLTLAFVQERGLGIDVALCASTLKVSDRYLCFNTSHAYAPCGEIEPSETSPFACEHIVLQLWDNILSLLSANPESETSAKEEHQLKSMVGKRLAQMPRNVKCRQTCRRGELSVSWESNEAVRQAKQPVTVVAHVASCNRSRSPFIIEDELSEEAGCGCPQMMSCVHSSGVTFSGLSTDEQYSATLARALEGSFFSLPADLQTPASENTEVMEVVEVDDDDEELDASGPELHREPIVSPSPRKTVLGSVNRLASIQREQLGVLFGAIPRTPAFSAQGYVPGAKIAHGSLDWGGSFPGSHDFYRTRDRSDEDIFILKPKSQPLNENGKRVYEHGEPRSVRYISD